jgi:hypothetical protein
MRTTYVTTALLSILLLSSFTVLAQAQSRDELLKQIEAKRAELYALEKDYLSPSEEDRSNYAAFLRTPDTGLIRILPRETYDDNANREKKRIVTRGGGAYYSFTRLTHEYGYGSDLELAQNKFSTGFAGLDYGLLTNIGDVPLESVTLETPAAATFAAYNPPSEEPKIRLEQRRFQMGADVQGISANRTVPMKLNSTYVLRSLNYDETDVIVAFKVVRIDSDGSAIILWKMLKKNPPPKYARSNDN